MINQLTYIAGQTQRQERLQRSLRAFELELPRRGGATRAKVAAAVAIVAGAFCAAVGVARADVIGQYTLTTPLAATWTAPARADLALVSASGAQGGAFVASDGSRTAGGLGSSASGWLALAPGESLTLWAGGRGGDGVVVAGGGSGCFQAGGTGGWPGGGTGGYASTSIGFGSCYSGAGGGGASQVRHSDNNLPVVVAAGGGGASFAGTGGQGGGLDGASGAGDTRAAGGGGQSGAGQPGFRFDCNCSYGASAGTSTSGGAGGSDSFVVGEGGGGGGQGWWGGGGGALGSGGGGSSYLAPELTDSSAVGGARSGDGTVEIIYGTADMPVVTAAAPPHAAAGTPFSYSFRASGWPIPSWSLEYGLLPPGLTLSHYGTLDGTTTQAGTYWFMVRAANPLHSVDATVKLVVDPAAATSIAPGAAQTTLVGTSFPNTINARVVDAYANGVPGLTVHFALPTDGTATFTGTGTTSVDATTDANGWADAGTVAAGSAPGPISLVISTPGTSLPNATIGLTVDAPAAFGNAVPPAATIGQQYSYKVPTTGYPGANVSLAGGALPAGLALAGDGTISGTPTAPGSYPFVLQASNGIGDPVEQQLALAVTDGRARTLTIHPASTPEGNTGTTPLAFAVTLDRTTVVPVSVSWKTADGTARAGSDYRAASGTLTIPAGSKGGHVKVRIIGDTRVERNETFTVTLSTPVGATVAVPTATGTILNDD